MPIGVNAWRAEGWLSTFSFHPRRAVGSSH
jgi:hypothetical protein